MARSDPPQGKRIEDLDKNFKLEQAAEEAPVRWLKASHRALTVRGLPWFAENKGKFWRLPARAEKLVRPAVWDIGRTPASAYITFRSNTTRMRVRFVNEYTRCMPHMPRSGSHGLYLYAGSPARMLPWAAAIPDAENLEFDRLLFQDVPAAMREFRLHLPPYHPLQSLAIGVDPGAKVLKPSPTALAGPVVFYGTSITQGGCADTAGGDYASMVGRCLNLEVVNLGFSGNGKGDRELADLMTEIDACLYVLDYWGNVSADELKRTLPPFVKILQTERPQTPILLMSDLCFPKAYHDKPLREKQIARRDVTMKFYADQRARGNRLLHFVDGFTLLPYGTDVANVDGVHLTGHGFHVVAQSLVPVIEQILEAKW